MERRHARPEDTPGLAAEDGGPIQGGGILGLVDSRAYNSSISTLSPEAARFILGLYSDPARPHLAKIHDLAQAKAQVEGWTVPGLRAVQLWLARQDRKLILAARDPKRYRDRCIPDIIRSKTAVGAMCLIVGDHHQFDVLWPRLEWERGKNGRRGACRWKWYRPWLTAWLDFRTWHVFAHAICFDSPNGDRVMGSFIRGVLEHGRPDHVYLDNGKDYRMKRFSGGRRRPCEPSERIVAKSHVQPLLTMLGIESHFALPYNAKTKPIEPWFGIVEERFGKAFGTYLGAKAQDRPERLRGIKADEYAARYFSGETLARLDNLRDEYEQPLRDGLCLTAFSALFKQWLNDDYSLRASPAKGAFGLAPKRAFYELRSKDFVVQRPDESSLALMLMPSVAIGVTKNGVWVNAFKNYYWSDNLNDLRCNGRTAKVTYRFDPGDASKIHVFTAVGDKFLAIATPYIGSGVHPLAHSLGTEADRRQLADSIDASRTISRNDRAIVRDRRKFAAAVLLDAQGELARQAGVLDAHDAIPKDHPQAAPVLRLAGPITEAAQEGRKHDERRAKDEERISAAEFYAAAQATGTDGPDADDRHRPPTALEQLALLGQEQENSNDSASGHAP